MASRKEVAARAKRVVVQDQLSAFGTPPLIEGEDAAAYGDFLAGISAVVKPKDFVEVIFTRDVVDLTWETQRMRRLKAALLTTALSIALQELLAEALGEGARVDNLSKRWAARDDAAINEVDKVLASNGLTMEGVVARTLSAHIDTVERIDRMGRIEAVKVSCVEASAWGPSKRTEADRASAFVTRSLERPGK
jgi:hypothetical protein